MTYEDAIQAVQHGSFRSASDADLREMLRACMDAGGAPLNRLHHVNQAAAAIRHELSDRKTKKILWFSGVAAVGTLVVIVDFILRLFRGH